MEIQEIPIGKIRRDPNQPRTYFDAIAIKEMAQSIKTEGCINPIEIDKNFVIVTGEMRWRSAKEAGLKTIPCKVIEIEPENRFRRQVIENVHHNTMGVKDTAVALEKLMPLVLKRAVRDKKETRGGSLDKGYTAMGEVIGKGRDWIRRHFDYLDSSSSFREAVGKGTPLSYIDIITEAPKELKARVEKKIIAGTFGTRDGARMVISAVNQHPEKTDELLDTNYTDLNTKEIYSTVHKIIPHFTETPASDALTKAFEPSQEITASALKLRDLLKKYSVADVGSFNVPRVILALRSVYAEMENWMKRAPGKQLTEGE